MTDKKKLGDRGEDYTARYLEKQGFHIVERNWHSRYGEIDIIAENEKYLLFVEVKTRRAGSMVPGKLLLPHRSSKSCGSRRKATCWNIPPIASHDLM